MRLCFVALALALTGCASIPGLKITDEERAACEAQGCTPWTDAELRDLAHRAIQYGYQQGRKSL